MRLHSKVGYFQILSANAGSTQTVSGIGFTPKVVFFFGCPGAGGAGDLDTVKGGILFMNGVADENGNQWVVAGNGRNSNADSDCDSYCATDRCISVRTFGGAGAFSECSISSMSSGQFVVNVLASTSSDFVVGYCALGGEAIEQVAVGSDTTGTTTSDIVVSGLGFKPDSLVVASTFDTSLGTKETDISFCIGVASSSSDDRCFSNYSQNGQASSNSKRYNSVDSILAQVDNTGLVGEADLDSMDSDGFTLNVSDAFPQDGYFFYVAMKGPQAYCGEFTHTTSTGTFDAPNGGGMSFPPKAGIIISGHATGGDPARYGVLDDLFYTTGFIGSTNDEAGNAAAYDEDNVATTDNSRYLDDDSCCVRINGNSIRSKSELSSFGTDKVTLDLTDAESTDTYYHQYMWWGDSQANPYYIYRQS